MRREILLSGLLIVIISSIAMGYPPPYYIYCVHELLFGLMAIWIFSLAFPGHILKKITEFCTLGFIIGVLILSPMISLCVPHYSVHFTGDATVHVNHLTRVIGERPYNSESETMAAEYIREVLKQNGYDPEGSPNIYVRVKGKREEVVFLCAHYDTVPGSPGADDNASGVSILLELDIPESPEYTFVLAFFTGEEAGLVESRYYAQDTEDPIIAVVCIDTVGVGRDFHISSVKKNRTTSFALSQLVYGLSEEGQPSIGPLISDHVPFNERGIPAVGLTRSTDREYPHIHSEQDTFVEGELLEKTGETVQKIIMHFSQSATPYRCVLMPVVISCIFSFIGALLFLHFLDFSDRGSSSPPT
ncbi:MAG: M28 family peptidase [Theionarchaea archaeon]|nr:M28 family peptidase [Theionarchaea archaeon]